MTPLIALLLLAIALFLAAFELVESHARSLLAWAVFLISVALLIERLS